ncbi:MAG: hypothetical protein ABW252_19845 [Polyangiales bacterium]
MSRTFSIWLFAWSLLAALAFGDATASAQGKKRVAIVAFEGPSASSIQAQVTRALKSERREVELISSRDVSNTADRLDNAMRSESDFRELGEALEVSAFIEGKSAKKGRNLATTVTVRNAANGEVVHEETWVKRRSQLKQIRPLVWDALGPAIAESSTPTAKTRGKAKPTKAPPPPPPEPEVDEELDEPEAPEEDEAEEAPPPPKPARKRPPPKPVEREPVAEAEPEEEAPAEPRGGLKKSGTHPALIASIGPRLTWRTLKYDGPTNFHSYKNEGGSPAFSMPLSIQYYPGAHSSNAWYSNLGLDLDFDYALGLKSKMQGETHKTTSYELGAGAIYRVPLTDFEPRFRIGYVRQVFDVDVPERTLLPALTYSAVRVGAGTAIKFVDWLSFDLAFAYLFVLDTGELGTADFGEDVTTGAWEAGAAFVLSLKEIYGVRLAMDYRRYKYDFSQTDNDQLPQLPNYGTDGYLRTTLSFQFKLPGVL